MKFLIIDGKRIAWTDIVKARKEQRKQARAQQLTLFELRHDSRPETECTAEGRYLEPSLLTLLDK